MNISRSGKTFQRTVKDLNEGVIIEYELKDIKNNSQNNMATQQNISQQNKILHSRPESEEVKQLIKEEEQFFYQFKNPEMCFSLSSSITSVCPVSTQNGNIKFMIPSNNDFIFISPSYLKQIGNEKLNEILISQNKQI